MKKYILALFFIIIIALSLLPFSLSNDGAYNNITRTLWCKTETACIHEIGHSIDQSSGYPSKSWEFGLSVRLYLNDELKKPEGSALAAQIFSFQFTHIEGRNNIVSWPMGELYAWIFAWSGGKAENMPEPFRKFYDFQRADELIEKYVR